MERGFGRELGEVVEKRLTALRFAAIAAKGNYPDGGGLYLQVQIGKDGKPRKSWLFRFVSPIERRERFMGLGSLDHVEMIVTLVHAGVWALE
jgi:hypothetical protein